MRPPTHHAPSTGAQRPSSNEPATSTRRSRSGRKTLRIAWVSHLSGNSEANCCIQSGSWSKTKNTPEVNCSTRTTGVTMADAPLAVLGHRRERDAEQRAEIRPSTIAQSEREPLLAGSAGRTRSKRATRRGSGSSPARRRRRRPGRSCRGSTTTLGIGVPCSRLSVPSSRSSGIAIARFWNDV